MKIKQEVHVKHLTKYLACNKHSISIAHYYFQFFSWCVSHNPLFRTGICTPLLPYTFYWATDVYPVSWWAILILRVTRLWNLLTGSLPHTEQAHNKRGWVELTNHHRLQCSWMLFIVFLHAPPTPAQEKPDPGTYSPTQSYREWNTTYRETLSPFQSQLPQWGQAGWHLSGGILEDLPLGKLSSLTQKVYRYR